MTKVRRKWTRETDSLIFERGASRNVIITLEPAGLVGFRLKGTRKTYSLTADKCYMMALKASIMHERKEKSKRKMSARRGLIF